MATAVSYVKKPAKAQRKTPRNLKALTLWPVFLVLPVSEGLPATGTAAWTALAFAVLMGHLLFGKGGRPAYPKLWIMAAYLAALGALSSGSVAENLRGHLINAVPIVLFILLGPYVLRYVVKDDPGTAGKLVSAFLIGQAVSAGAAIAQMLGYTTFGHQLLLGRARGLAGHPNTLGVLAGVAIVLVIFLIAKGEGRRLLLVAAFLLNAAALLASGSVSALIACLIGVLVVLAAARVPLRVPILVAGGGALSLWALTQLTAESGALRGPMERFLQVTGQTSQASSLDIRQNTYAYAWEQIQKNPFYGAGLDDASGATFNNSTLTHNVLLRSWFQGGLGMGLAFALIYGAIVLMIIGAILQGMNAASAGVLAVIIGFSMTSAALQQGYFWLLIFGAWALVEPRNVPDKVDRQLARYLSLQQAQPPKP